MHENAFSPPLPSIRWGIIGLLSTLAITSVHIFLIWGYTGFWGDGGRWRHEVARYIHGETLYRDFVWPYPPFALWFMGWIGRIFGDGTTVFFAAAAVITLLLAATYFACCSALLKNRWTVAVIPPLGIILALSYGQIASDPLPSGAYTPSAPLGALFLMVGLVASLSENPLIAGIACGFAIVTKQDFWLPAAAILAAMVVQRRRRASLACLCAMTVILAVVAVVTAQSGRQTLWLIVTGYGRAGLQRARPMPSWERVTAELAGVTLILGVFLTALRRWRPAAVTLGIYVIANVLLFVNASNFGEFRKIVLLHQFSLALPLIGLLWAIRTRNPDLAWLFAIAFCASARRGFERTDWVCLPLELPLYALMLHRHKLDRAIPPLAFASLLIGFSAYWQFGVGPLTAQYANRVWLNTAKGAVNWPSHEAALYQRLQYELTNHKDAPLLAFLYTGGFNYYLNRVNPSASDEGLLFSGRDPDSEVVRIRAAHPVLLYTGYYERVRVTLAPRINSWRPALSMDPRWTLERPIFEKLSAGCDRSPVGRTTPEFWIYRCR